MQRKNSKSKINGKIIMMQNDLMSKLASSEPSSYKQIDELGFPGKNSQFDSLTNLLSKAKGVTLANQEKIQAEKRSSQNLESLKKISNPHQKRKSHVIDTKSPSIGSTKLGQKDKAQQDEGTFLTGVGLAKNDENQDPISIEKQGLNEEQTYHRQIHRGYYSNQTKFREEESPDEMIKEMIRKNKSDDLEELRRMIKETDESLQSYGKQLQRTRKDVMGMAERYSDIDYHLVDKITRHGTSTHGEY